MNCATYGSEEQRKSMAENIQQRLSELTRLKAERERVIRFCEYKEFKDGLSATDAILSILKQKDGE
jgi:hypothetical protein